MESAMVNHPPAFHRRAAGVVASLCVAAALAVVAGQSLLVQEGDPRINIRWRPGIADSQRAALERQLSLSPVEQLQGDTWRYQLHDTSARSIAAIVQHPDVEDTHHIDRADFDVAGDAPRDERRPGPLGQRWPAVAYLMSDYGPSVLVVLALLAGGYAARPDVARAVSHRTGAAVTRGIPSITPRTLAMFRLVFGLIAAYYVLDLPFPDKRVPPDPYRTDAFVYVAPVHWLAERPPLVRAGQAVATAALAIFAVGIAARPAYAVAMVGVTTWLLALTLRGGTHAYSVLLLPLLALLAVPWGDAPPIYRFFGARPVETRPPSKRYGYAPWMLCFALGVALAGAAWAKVSEGPAWITNGTVRYHFVTDIDYATVDWGLKVATMPRLAVAMSAAAVAVEAATIVAAFVTLPLLRVALGLAAAGLLTGFYLFQGLLWPAWWILLLGFLPWQWLDRSAPATAPATRDVPRRWQLLCAIGLALQQVVTSTAEIELEPFGSQYDMYSDTHASPADYDSENPGTVRRIHGIEEGDRRRDLTDCAMRIGGPMSEALIDPTLPVPERAAEVVACQPADEPPPKGFVVLEDQCRFNWEKGGFYCLYRDKVIATLPATP